MTTNVERGVSSVDAAVRDARRRLEQERGARAAQLAALEQAVGQVPVEQVEESDRTRAENLRQSLAEIDGALGRLQDGTYGRCEGCAKDIPAGRLEILPYVRYCVRCQGRHDRAFR
ncbi:TraR/DksA family transcriptional regulator [Actinomadura hibisca]|uniref:TraR/DksA family transcriptional regulator n=1 Tax=Actinomadura hibisca TaxID=68565 RepID=UPI00082EFCCD|nr:TraR/DksA C4-type zinc finger protein [Actinomadura hibisca]